MKELEIRHTNVFRRNLEAVEAGKRFIINEGGTRSSKTYSIIQLLIFFALSKKTSISVIRKSFPVLRGSILRDFLDIMKDLNIYKEKKHNKSNNIYEFDNGSTIEFFSIDLATKVRGRKRDICYINEANELMQEDFMQLAIRTTQIIIMDYNPSEAESFLYDLTKDDRSILIKSTYKDNTFLSKEIITEIENLINVDENYYKIYCLGEKPTSTSRIYTHFKQYVEDIQSDDYCYGLDFGYTHPSALIKCYFIGNKVYCEELIYESKLTAKDMVAKMKNVIMDNKPIYADYSRPEIIEELRQNGFNIREAVKNVKAGIDTVKSSEVYIHHESLNTLREYRLYSWKSQGEQLLDEPIKLNDDSMDAIRYALHTHKKKSFNSTYVGFY